MHAGMERAPRRRRSDAASTQVRDRNTGSLRRGSMAPLTLRQVQGHFPRGSLTSAKPRRGSLYYDGAAFAAV